MQELKAIDFQGKNHYLTSNGIPNKPEKQGLLLEENQVANIIGNIIPEA